MALCAEKANSCRRRANPALPLGYANHASPSRTARVCGACNGATFRDRAREEPEREAPTMWPLQRKTRQLSGSARRGLGHRSRRRERRPPTSAQGACRHSFTSARRARERSPARAEGPGWCRACPNRRSSSRTRSNRKPVPPCRRRRSPRSLVAKIECGYASKNVLARLSSAPDQPGIPNLEMPSWCPPRAETHAPSVRIDERSSPSLRGATVIRAALCLLAAPSAHDKTKAQNCPPR